MAMQRISLLGSTGSIGVNTLNVVERHPDKYQIFALAANESVDLILQQCRKFKPVYAVLKNSSAAQRLAETLQSENLNITVLSGDKGLEQVSCDPSVDTVVAAIVGAAGLSSTMAAVESGKKVLLANKEALVMSGDLFTQAAKASGAQILPVDSEHNAIYQCLPQNGASLKDAGVKKIILTGSGGPFRTRPLAELGSVSPEEACAHPNWEMGKKISVDSATMMNKGLEFIEACWLFNAQPTDIEVVIHPQSIVHSMVSYLDGSVLAQLGNPDMRTPLAHCLAWPERIESGVDALDFQAVGALEFSAPDFQRFPCLRLAMDAIELGGSAPTALNAANEVAVAGFLAGEIAFLDIARVIAQVMESWVNSEPKCLNEVIEADLRARDQAKNILKTHSGLNK